MGDFDPIKALREELHGLADVHKVLVAHTHESERKLAEAEADHNAFVKMEAFMKDVLSRQREKLRAMEIEAERKATET